MTPSEIAGNYDRLAERWSSDSYPRDYGIAQHERALAFLARKGRALDIGCGSSGRIVDLLIRRGFAVEGLDLSARMLELARHKHPEVTFHHGDVRDWEIPAVYDFVSAWDSLWHVPLADQERALRRILAALESGGVCIFTAGGLDRPAEKVDSAMGVEMYYATLGIPTMLRILADSGCVCRHSNTISIPNCICA